MNTRRLKHIYGPVPSRRLGRSLGIDLVPYKTCTYDCIYCHLGPTTNKTIKRREYVAIADIIQELEEKLSGSDTFDYISLAGSGEPTLNSGIGDLILKLKSMTRIPVAVLTNGSLLWMKEIQEALMPADLILPSLDAGDSLLFQYTNRPHKDISFEQMINGLAGFSNRYKGEIWLEIFLLAGVTGIRDEVEKINSIIKGIKLSRIQLNTVARPPAKTFATPLSQRQMVSLKSIFSGQVEIISDRNKKYRQRLAASDSTRNDVLSLISRRPCTSSDIARSLGLKVAEALKHLDALILAGKVATVRLSEKTFYAAKESSHALRS
ncbi:MAG: radical SAM protein [Acidobacteria bacterium]|nr:radical SAM protein [Acidobacteriota bacterium]